MAQPFRLYNTLTRSVEDFVPLQPGKIGLYVCGMTVYDDIHVGHARAMVVFDSFVRYFQHRGWDVTFVRNFTDVDDKIIRRANELGEEPLALAQRYIDNFHRDTDALGLARPTHEPKVSTTIDGIQAMIGQLIERGHAYEAEGNVWFAVKTDDHYGCLSGQKVDELRSEDPGDGKKHAADFALWKAAKPGEPSWDSPWGPGRPGWHIECSAMSAATLGETIDIHGGGLDLVFPHHENEIAQSTCAHGKPYARYWLHNGLLTMGDGAKMGKSLGNAFNVHLAVDQYPAEAVRLYYLQAHYRSPLPWNGFYDKANGVVRAPELNEALSMLARLYEARQTAAGMSGEEPAKQVIDSLGEDAKTVFDLGNAFVERFYKALDSDFNTSEALGATFELARAINRFSNHKKAKKRGAPVVAPALKALEVVAPALGLLTMSNAAFEDEVKAKRLKAMGLTLDEVEALVAARTDARTNKDWARADTIRDELVEKSIEVMDMPDGVRWRVAL